MAEHHLPPEHAANHHARKGVHADELKPASRRRYSSGANPMRTLCFVLLVVLLLVGVTALLLYVVYRPTRPSFSVTSIAVYSLSNVTATTGGAALTSSLQVTLVISNPSRRSAARYDRLTAYVAYRGETITAPEVLPPLAQDPGSAVSAAPVVWGGVPVPVSPGTAAALATDVSYGVVSLRVLLLGRVRFLAGPFRSGWHSMYARCDLLVGVRKGAGEGGAAAGDSEAPLLSNPICDVDM